MRTIRSSILLAIVTGAIAMTSPSSAAPPAAKEVEQLAKRKKLCDQGYRAYCMPTKTNTGKKADTNPRPTAKPQVSHQTHTATPAYKQVDKPERRSARDVIYGSSEAEQAAKQDTEGLAAGAAKLKERADRKARCAKGEKLYCPNAITSETNPNDDNTKQVPVNKSNRQRGTKTHTATPAYKQVDKPERRSARDVIYGSSEAEQAAKQDTEGLAAGAAKLKERADRKARCAKGEKLYCPNAITSETNPNDDNTKQVPVNKSNRQRGTKTHTATPAYKQVDKPERRSARDVIYGSSEAEQAAKIKFTQTNNEKACDAETDDGCED